jgi:serine/threonine-protein kinase
MRYEILRKLARGGMGEVFLARQVGFGGFSKDVVLKRLHAEYAEDPDLVAMFLQEARIAALLEHPNIVQILELGRSRGRYFLVMEHVPGLSLSRTLAAAGTQLPLPIAIQIAAGVASGLQYAHDRRDPHGKPLNLVHRDVSPPNILLSTAGDIKVTDFGIAKVVGAARTEAGVIKGKYSYISPEQARGGDADRRSDVYSLGLVIYEITTGQRAFPLGSDHEVLEAVARNRFQLPERVVPGYPDDLRAILLRALALDPGERYSECQELQDDLAALLEKWGEAASPRRLGQLVGSMAVREHDQRHGGVEESPATERDMPIVPDYDDEGLTVDLG